MQDSNDYKYFDFKSRVVPNKALEVRNNLYMIKRVKVYVPHLHPTVFINANLYRIDIECTNGKTFIYGFKNVNVYKNENDGTDKIVVSGYPYWLEDIKQWEIYKYEL